ncbi:MAG: hypothetical protein IKB09_12360 [Oscillospiraceae bacterium]|nr:hypothetical protein [Oscillospiraceae bacterium]
MQENRFDILNGNHLKLIAAFTMLLDHAGILLFPRVQLFRILGRLAYPIFAFMIAEGCRYTRNKLRYFLMVFGLGAACQLVYYFVGGDTYLNILLTFSCSILLIFLMQAVYKAQDWLRRFWLSLLLAFAFAAVYGLTRLVTIDYGFWGVLVPVLVSLAHIRQWPRWAELVLLGAGLVLLGADLGGIQHYALLSVPLLLLYNGQRGKANLKYFFYIFYPVHLAVLQGIAWLVR